MVRLKEMCGQYWYYEIYKFQFLMVRLKDSVIDNNIDDKIIFQFLMVRLKVGWLVYLSV